MRDLNLALLGLARIAGLSLSEVESLPLSRLRSLLRTFAKARNTP